MQHHILRKLHVVERNERSELGKKMHEDLQLSVLMKGCKVVRQTGKPGDENQPIKLLSNQQDKQNLMLVGEQKSIENQINNQLHEKEEQQSIHKLLDKAQKMKRQVMRLKLKNFDNLTN